MFSNYIFVQHSKEIESRQICSLRLISRILEVVDWEALISRQACAPFHYTLITNGVDVRPNEDCFFSKGDEVHCDVPACNGKKSSDSERTAKFLDGFWGSIKGVASQSWM